LIQCFIHDLLNQVVQKITSITVSVPDFIYKQR